MQASDNNAAGGQLPAVRTTNSFYGGNEPDQKLIHDDAESTANDMRERLFVAEKVMRSLFDRNKQLEDMVS